MSIYSYLNVFYNIHFFQRFYGIGISSILLIHLKSDFWTVIACLLVLVEILFSSLISFVTLKTYHKLHYDITVPIYCVRKIIVRNKKGPINVYLRRLL